MSFDIYLDETCQTSHHYMVLGGAVTWTRKVGQLSTDLRRMRGASRSPIKWSNLRAHNLETYKQFVDHVFMLVRERHIHIHVLILDCSKFDHKTYNDGDKEAGFSKFLGQLIMHKFAKRYPPPLYVYPDHRDTKDDPEAIGKLLNVTLEKKYSVKGHPIRRMQFRKTPKTPMLWIPDLIIGAIGYEKNEKHLKAGAAKHKIELAQHIRSRAKCRPDWPNKGLWPRPAFSVWNFDFTKSRK